MANNNTTIKDPCFCLFSCGKIPDKPVCPVKSGDCCLYICDILVKSNDGVAPCGNKGSLNILDAYHEIDCCSGNPSFSIESYDKKFLTSASITASGELSWVTGTSDTAGMYTELNVKACCLTEDGIKLERLFCVTIGVKNLCLCPGCEECETCDPCTGSCVSNDANIKVQESSQKSNLQVNG